MDQSSHGEVSYGGGGGGGDGSNAMMGAGAAVRECKGDPNLGNTQAANVKNSYPGMRGNGKYWARSDEMGGVSGAMMGQMSSQELGLGSGLGLGYNYDEPLGGVRIVELARRGLHLMDLSGPSTSGQHAGPGSGKGDFKLSQENELRMGDRKLPIKPNMGNGGSGGKHGGGKKSSATATLLGMNDAGWGSLWVMFLGLGVTAGVFVLL